VFGFTIKSHLYGDFLGAEVKEMDLNHNLLCLLLAYCIYSVTGRVGVFEGIGCVFVSSFF